MRGLVVAWVMGFAVVCGAQEPVYRVAGRVVSARDGVAVARAAVELTPIPEGKTVEVVSDEDGAFQFVGVAKGTYRLVGSRTGFLTAAYQEHGGFSTAIVTGAGVDTEGLRLELKRLGRIGGRVVDEAGDPVRQATITLFRESRETGTVRTMRFRTAQTDDAGSYELDRLAPGRYYVMASATPWYAVHPQVPLEVPAAPPEQRGNAPQVLAARAYAQYSQTGIVDGVDAALDVAYPETFFAGTTDASGAEVIAIEGGEQVQADLRLVAVRAVVVTIPIARDQEQNRRIPTLQRRVFDAVEPVRTEVQNDGNGFRLAGVVPGQYELREESVEVRGRTGVGRNGVARSGVVEVGERGAVVEAGWGRELGGLKVTVEVAKGAKPVGSMRVVLLSTVAARGQGAAVGAKGEATFAGVEPGEYGLEVLAGNRRLGVVEMRGAAGKTVKVESGAAKELTVVVAAGSGSLYGSAKRDGKPVAGAMLLLLAADEDVRTSPEQRQQSDLDGSFDFQGVAPGRYLLVGIEDGWEVGWRDTGVLAKYLGKAVPVVVPDVVGWTMKMAEAVEVQGR